MFLRQINFSPRTPRGVELTGKTTDAETGIESSGFMKSRTGEYLTSRRGEVKITHLVQGTFAGAITAHDTPRRKGLPRFHLDV